MTSHPSFAFVYSFKSRAPLGPLCPFGALLATVVVVGIGSGSDASVDAAVDLVLIVLCGRGIGVRGGHHLGLCAEAGASAAGNGIRSAPADSGAGAAGASSSVSELSSLSSSRA